MGNVFISGGKIGMYTPYLSRLPKGYTEVEYIRSTGSQYIDTGFKPNQNTKVVLDFQLCDAYDWSCLFGARKAVGVNELQYAFWQNDVDKFLVGANSNLMTFTQSHAITERHTFTADKGVITLDNESLNFAFGTFQSPVNMTLFASNGGGEIEYHSKMKLYSCQMYNNGTLVRDFVPCSSDDYGVGLYDLAEGKFYPNNGTGAFIAGKPVGKPIEGLMVSELMDGTLIKLNVGGTPMDFRVVNQGVPCGSTLYDSSCNGTWLEMVNVYSKLAWSNTTNKGYHQSNLPSYMDNTFIPLLDANVQELVKTVKIPYGSTPANKTVVSGANGLSVKAFPLSAYELGGTDAESNALLGDGACLSYYNDTTTNKKAKRIAYYTDGTVAYWHTRTPVGYYYNTMSVVVNEGGGFSNATMTNQYGVRPTIILPLDTLVSEEPNADGSFNLIV